MNETNSEFVYPPGHNWEGLTPSQVNRAYENQETNHIEEMMKPESGKEVRVEILGSREDSDDYSKP